MFEVSWGEILLMLTAAVLFLKPEDLPKVLRSVIKAWRWLKRFVQDVHAQIDKTLMLDELQETQKEITQSVKMIQGDDGQHYASYALDDVVDASRKPVAAPKNESADEPR